MFVWRWNKVDGKIWRENMNKNFFRVCLVSWGGRKINGGAWMFSLQNGEKTRWNAFFLDWQKCPCASTHGLRLVAFFIFIFIFYNLGVIVVVVVVFFFFLIDVIFFWTWFFINKFGWLLFFFFLVVICHFFVLIGHHSLIRVYK